MTLKVLTNANTAVYLNADGLIQRYGNTEHGPSTGGEYDTLGGLRQIEVNIPDLTKLSTAGAPAIVDDVITFPKGAYIRKVEVINTALATTTGAGAATLDVGLVKRDQATEADYNGIVAALAYTSFNSLGEATTIEGSQASGAGALVGTTSGTDTGGYYITANYNTTTFLTGGVKVRILYDFAGS